MRINKLLISLSVIAIAMTACVKEDHSLTQEQSKVTLDVNFDETNLICNMDDLNGKKVAILTGCFQEEILEKQYPEVETEFMFVDNAAMRLIQWPSSFDVMVTENMFGDILTDEGSVITGSMGLLPSASIGVHTSLFEPIHGSWPQAKGLNIANPLATILSAAMMFEYAFGLLEEGALIREAVNASMAANVCTPDLQADGDTKYGTAEVGAWIVDYINKK